MKLLQILKQVLAGLENMTSEQFSQGADKPLRELLSKIIVDEQASIDAGGHMETAWDFVEMWYPNYTSSNLIMRADDLQKILDGEAKEDSGAYELLHKEFGGKNSELVFNEYNAVHEQIYREAILNFIKSTK